MNPMQGKEDFIKFTREYSYQMVFFSAMEALINVLEGQCGCEVNRN